MELEIKSIAFDNLSFNFNSEDPILRKSTFEFPMNSVVRLHGPHGCGKSTVLKTLCGLVEPTSGNFKVNGNTINEMTFEDFIPYRLKIGYGFDYGGLINNRTIYQNLMLPLQYHKKISESEAKERVTNIIERFGLQSSARHRPSAVSGSHRKLACVARAFILKPEVLILDDPSHGLNQISVETLIQVILEGKIENWLKHVFLTTENSMLIDGVVDTDIVMREGKIVDFEKIYQSAIGEEKAS